LAVWPENVSPTTSLSLARSLDARVQTCDSGNNSFSSNPAALGGLVGVKGKAGNAEQSSDQESGSTATDSAGSSASGGASKYAGQGNQLLSQGRAMLMRAQQAAASETDPQRRAALMAAARQGQAQMATAERQAGAVQNGGTEAEAMALVQSGRAQIAAAQQQASQLQSSGSSSYSADGKGSDAGNSGPALIDIQA
jgi:uncharacterized cupin superfamily protein